MTTTPSATAALSQLRRLLETIGDALVGSRVDALLCAEAQFETVIQCLRAAPRPRDDDEFREELSRCVRALARCRRLGDASQRLASGLLQISGVLPAYTREGDVAGSPLYGRLEARG